MENTAPKRLVHARWEIRPRDGGPPIRGDLRAPEGPSPHSAVVICHGFKGFKDWGFFPELARAIAWHGHAALSFNFSHSGIGADGVDFSALDLFEQGTHSHNVREIGMVIDAIFGGRLFPRAPERIGLFGHSRGGGEAVLAADDARIDALVTWSAIADVDRWSPQQVERWERGETVMIPNSRTGQQMPLGPVYWEDLQQNRARLDIQRAAARVSVPWLIVHGEEDRSVAVQDAHALFEAAGDNAEMLLVEDAGHTYGAVHPYAGAAPELRTAAAATLRWFDTRLGRA